MPAAASPVSSRRTTSRTDMRGSRVTRSRTTPPIQAMCGLTAMASAYHPAVRAENQRCWVRAFRAEDSSQGSREMPSR